MSSVKKTVSKVTAGDVLKKLRASYGRKRRNTASGLRVIAIAGTEHTSELCQLIGDVLAADGIKAALFTTHRISIDGRHKDVKGDMAVTNKRVRRAFFRNAKRAGTEWVIMEVPVEVLAGNGFFEVSVELAIITTLFGVQGVPPLANGMAEYAQLITSHNPKTVILNADDEWFEYLGRKVKNKLVTVGEAKATYQIKGTEVVGKTLKFSVISAKGAIVVQHTHSSVDVVLPTAMAIAAARYVGCSDAAITRGIKSIG